MSLISKLEPVHKLFMNENKQQEQRLSLRKMNSSDIDDFMVWATDDEVTKHMMWNSYSTRAEAESFFKDIVEKHTWFKGVCLGDKIIGSLTLDKGKGIHGCKAELGYVIARKYWGKGYATEAIKLVVKSGFADLEIERIEAFVDPKNVASQRVLEKNGFTQEGLMRSCVVQKGKVKDRLIYSILKTEVK